MRWLTERVLVRGRWEDWLLLKDHLPKEGLAELASQLKVPAREANFFWLHVGGCPELSGSLTVNRQTIAKESTMTNQNTNYLFQSFPSLFPEDRSDPRRTLMCFGFEVGDGWFELLKECFSRLAALGDECEITQVKEKWGTLRIHADTSRAADKIITEYEERSRLICEECGQPGTLRTDGWYRTTCEQHVPTR